MRRWAPTSTVAVVLCILLGSQVVQAQVGRVSPSERSVVTDAETGAELVVLTNAKQSDAKIYQTHPQWSADGEWVIFRSGGRSPGSQAYAVNERDGKIVQLTEGVGNNTGSLCVAKNSMKLYFIRNKTQHDRGLPPAGVEVAPPAPVDEAELEYQVVQLDLERLLSDALTNNVASAEPYEKVCATLPRGMRMGSGAALDADEASLYMAARGGDVGQHLPVGTEVWVKPEGMRMGTGPGGLRKIDLSTGEMSVVIDAPFQIGHLQTNPWVTGEIVYCHETGGDAPQRVWTVMADGSGNRPLFAEQPLDWVTHEAVVTRDEVMFNLIGHQKRLRVRPTGIAIVNLRTDAVELLGQLDEREPAGEGESYGGFWHCNGSPDGRWAVGDTFGGDLWLIDRRDGRRTLLTTDHQMKPDHLHPSFKDDGTKILVQSGKFTNGEKLQLVVIPVPQDR